MVERINPQDCGGVCAKFYDRVTAVIRVLCPDDERDDSIIKQDVLQRIERLRKKPDTLKTRQTIQSEIEKLWLLSEIKDEKGNPIYNFTDKIRKMYNDYEDMVFSLSINSNESVKTIRSFTLEERIGFQKRLTRWLMDKQKRSNPSGQTEI